MFEWDPAKNRANERKHGISFADTFAVFEDPYALTMETVEDEEERYVTLGMDALARLLVVVYAWRQEDIRIISARKATKTEAKHYESQL